MNQCCSHCHVFEVLSPTQNLLDHPIKFPTDLKRVNNDFNQLVNSQIHLVNAGRVITFQIESMTNTESSYHLLPRHSNLSHSSECGKNSMHSR